MSEAADRQDYFADRALKCESDVMMPYGLQKAYVKLAIVPVLLKINKQLFFILCSEIASRSSAPFSFEFRSVVCRCFHLAS